MADVLKMIEDGKVRRFFRSRNKLLNAGLFSHVTQRAAGQDVLFVEEDDFLAMLGLLKELSKKHEASVHAFCLMPNHIHLLMRPGQDNLHCFFRDLCGRYARRFNRRYERRGHLFGGAFRQSVILDEAYLLAVSLYIHLNPVRARLVEDAKEYRFSSCRLYTDEKAPKSFVQPRPVLSLLSNGREEQAASYRNLLERGKGADSGNVLEDEGAIERLAKFLKTFISAAARGSRKRGEDSPFLSGPIPEELFEDFERLRRSKRPESIGAKKYIIGQLLSRGYTRTQICEFLGVCRKTVYNLGSSDPG
ncbi:MAG TPA: transposase [Thermodesulfobacteriota bacterium]|nr:transposase [Thermodesulfobacteriota bacterium]